MIELGNNVRPGSNGRQGAIKHCHPLNERQGNDLSSLHDPDHAHH